MLAYMVMAIFHHFRATIYLFDQYGRLLNHTNVFLQFLQMPEWAHHTRMTSHIYWPNLKDTKCKNSFDQFTLWKSDRFYLLIIVTFSCFSSAEDRTDSSQSSWSLLNPPLNIVNLCCRPSITETTTKYGNLNLLAHSLLVSLVSV